METKKTTTKKTTAKKTTAKKTTTKKTAAKKPAAPKAEPAPVKFKTYRFIKNENKNKFLNCYAVCGQIAKASRAAGINQFTHYYWMEDPEYVKAFEKAKEVAADYLEEVAIARATSGRKPSDRLLEFLLKAARPEKYKERTETNITGLGPAEFRWEGGGESEADNDSVPPAKDMGADDSSGT